MLKNNVFLILGGTGNIGSAIAGALEKEGAVVCRHGLEPGEYQFNLSKDGEPKKLVGKVLKDYGRIDGLINSISASAKIAPFEKKSWADFVGHLNVQLKAAVEITNLILPQLKERGGDIINILSTYVVSEPPPSLSDYVTAKYAMLGLTAALLKDLAKYKVRVNAVSPSFIRNHFTSDVPAKLDELLAAKSPLNRLTNTADVASAVLDLLQRGDNGKHVVIDGGHVQIKSL